jgi:arsenite methyltransferase
VSQLTFDAAASTAMEAVYLTPDLIAQRAKVLDLLVPSPGEAVLDIGVGPGLLAYDLARLVGEAGRVAGLDTSADMLGMAEARLAGFPQVELVQADATALPFPDGAFDAAVSTQVYEYVSDMPEALAELHRVLRPGGRALILDSDWRSVVWASSDQARMDRVLTCWDDHLADPHLPGRLGPMLRRAGFEVRRVEVSPMLAPRWQPQGYAAGMMRMIHQFALDHGARHGLSREEVAAWRADQQRLIEADEFFFSLNRYLFLATR